MQLRPYQEGLKSRTYERWQLSRFVLAVMPTGAGKSATLAAIVREHRGNSVVLAHRRELVGQLSTAIAREGVQHQIIGPTSLIQDVVRNHMREFGRTFYAPNALCSVASVQTVVARSADLKPWAAQQTLWVMDEAHHIVGNDRTTRNTWGKAVELFTNARGLGVTATPGRADGKGLGSHASGVFDAMVEGPKPRELIDAGYLTDFRIWCPPNDIKLDEVPVSEATGDYAKPALKKAVRASHIVGDVFDHRQRLAPGLQTLIFASDVETAADITAKFNSNGIRAELVTAETDDGLRSSIVQQFRNRQFSVMVNVDLFGEGVDLPGVECVILARPTQSLAVFLQQFGRGLRPLYATGYDLSTQAGRLAAIAASGKPYAIIIDPVGNTIIHGKPDQARLWSLDDRERKSRSSKTDDSIALRVCLNVLCVQPFERFRTVCPYCAAPVVPGGRGSPEQVDGDLFELETVALDRLRAERNNVDRDADSIGNGLAHSGAPQLAVFGAMKNHRLRQDAQVTLRETIAWWCAWYRDSHTDREIQKLFYLTFGLDILSAQALGRTEAAELTTRVKSK